jgi:hypothetical protein
MPKPNASATALGGGPNQDDHAIACSCIRDSGASAVIENSVEDAARGV